MRPTVIGLFVGLILGLALVLEGFAEMLLVGFCGAVGFFVMKVVEGEIDLSEYINRSSNRRP